MKGRNKLMQGNLKQKPTVQLGDDDLISCKECDGKRFEQAYQLFRVSPLMNGGKVGVHPVPVFVCYNCGVVVEKEYIENLKI